MFYFVIICKTLQIFKVSRLGFSIVSSVRIVRQRNPSNKTNPEIIILL